MSSGDLEGLDTECQGLWNKIDNLLEGPLNDIVLDSKSTSLLDRFKEHACKKDTWNGDLYKENLKIAINKLQTWNENFNKLSEVQQSKSLFFKFVDNSKITY